MSGLIVNKEAFRIIYWQLFLVVGLAVVLFLFQGIQSGVSAFLGGLAYWLPTLLFVWRVFSRASARTAKQFLVAFMLGETMKLVLSAVLFLLVMNYFPVKLTSVLIGFVGAVVAFWIASLLLLARHEETSQ